MRETADMNPMKSVKSIASEYILHTGHTATARLELTSVTGWCECI